MTTYPYKTALVCLSLAVLAGCADTRKLSSLQSEFNRTVQQERPCRDQGTFKNLGKNLECAGDFQAIFLGIANEAKKTIEKRGQKDVVTVGLYTIAALALWQGGSPVEKIAGFAADGYDLCKNGGIESETPRNCALLRAASWLAAADRNLRKIDDLEKEFDATMTANGNSQQCREELVKETDDVEPKQKTLSNLIKDYRGNMFGDRIDRLGEAEKIERLHKSVIDFFSDQRKEARGGASDLVDIAETCSEPGLLKTDNACDCAHGNLTANQCGVTDDNPLAHEIFLAHCLEGDIKKKAEAATEAKTTGDAGAGG